MCKTCLSFPLDALEARQRGLVTLLLLLLRLAVGGGGLGATVPVARGSDAKPVAYNAAIPGALGSVVALVAARGFNAVWTVERAVVVIVAIAIVIVGIATGAPEAPSAAAHGHGASIRKIIVRMDRRGWRCEYRGRTGRIRCSADRTLHLDDIHLGSMGGGKAKRLGGCGSREQPRQVAIIALGEKRSIAPLQLGPLGLVCSGITTTKCTQAVSGSSAAADQARPGNR